MDTSKNKLVVLLLLLFVFIAAIFAVLIGYRLSNGDSTVGNPNAAISCSYCDLAYDKVACQTNCNATNATNAGILCPDGTTEKQIVRNDQSSFVGCKPNGANITTSSGTGESCNAKIPTIAGFTKSYYGYCMYEPVSNCRWWNPAKGGVNTKSAWEDCGCGASSDAAVTSQCNTSNAGKQISYKCSACGQDAGAICPSTFEPKADRTFTGQITCTDNGVSPVATKAVANATITLTDSKGVSNTMKSDASGNFTFSRTGDPESMLYTVAVSSTNGVSPTITAAAIVALGFTASPTVGCIPGANTDTNSKTNCNVTCLKDASGTNYVTCTAGTGASKGYNFNVGKCDTPANPTNYTCYKCDNTKTPWTVVSNTQTTPCVSPLSATKADVDKACVQKTLTCYSCKDGATKTDVINETAGVALVCPTGTSTTQPASCKVTCNSCQTVGGVNQNVTKEFNDTVCPTGYFPTAQTCANTCYYCDKTDTYNWSVKSESSNNAACDNSKGRYSSSASLTSCVAPKVDINISKKAVKYELGATDKAVFDIVVKNVSTDSVTAKGPIKIVEKYDDGLVYDSVTGDFTCGSVDAVNRTYSCTYAGDLAKDATKTMKVTFTVTKKNVDLNNKVFVSLPNHPQGTPCVDGDTTTTGKNETKCDNNNSTDKVIVKEVASSSSATTTAKSTSTATATATATPTSTSTATATIKTLPATAEDVSDRIYIMSAFGLLIIALGLVGYKLNINSIAAQATGRKVGSRRFESSFDDEK